MPELPLGGLKVLDLTTARSGPVAVRQLADWGAEVIQICPPAGGKRQDYGNWQLEGDYQNLHRNKRSLSLDLKHPAGRDIFFKMAATADVVVENFRPQVKHRLGIDYESLSRDNARLIYASISGFGQEGPYAERPAFDQIIQAMSGLMSVTGFPGQEPMRAGFAASDVLAGLYLAQAIFIALFERERSGRGQWVQTSLLEALVAALDFQAARWLVDGDVPQPVGNNHPSAPAMGVFPCADGRVSIAPAGDAMFRALCVAVEAPELAERPEYGSHVERMRNRAALDGELAGYTSRLPAAVLIERLNAAGVPCGPINDIPAALADPQLVQQGMIWAYRHEQLGKRALVGQPITLTRTPHRGVRSPPATMGAHTDAVLGELGLSAAEIAALREDAVI